MAWTVKLTQRPKSDDFRSGFFPRVFAYKADALQLVAEVQRKGGQAVYHKGTYNTHEDIRQQQQLRGFKSL